MRALSRKKANRTSTMRNLATSLILYERIQTTTAKAKETKQVVEKLINAARPGNLTARRRLMAYLFDENATKKVLEDILPRYKNIPFGFIKTYKLGRRLGDGAEMMVLELVKGEKNTKSDSVTLAQETNTKKAGQSSTDRKGQNATDKESRAPKARRTTTKAKSTNKASK